MRWRGWKTLETGTSPSSGGSTPRHWRPVRARNANWSSSDHLCAALRISKRQTGLATSTDQPRELRCAASLGWRQNPGTDPAVHTAQKARLGTGKSVAKSAQFRHLGWHWGKLVHSKVSTIAPSRTYAPDRKSTRLNSSHAN